MTTLKQRKLKPIRKQIRQSIKQKVYNTLVMLKIKEKYHVNNLP